MVTIFVRSANRRLRGWDMKTLKLLSTIILIMSLSACSTNYELDSEEYYKLALKV
jgi:hypothetical protein